MFRNGADQVKYPRAAEHLDDGLFQSLPKHQGWTQNAPLLPFLRCSRWPVTDPLLSMLRAPPQEWKQWLARSLQWSADHGPFNGQQAHSLQRPSLRRVPRAAPSAHYHAPVPVEKKTVVPQGRAIHQQSDHYSIAGTAKSLSVELSEK